MRREILIIEDLRVIAGGKPLVDGVGLTLARGEVLGLIGESGAGKTTLGLAALGYTRPGCTIAGGRILFDGQDIRAMASSERRRLRGRRIAYVAQSAAAAFNPARTLIDQACEGPLRHGLFSKEEARANAIALFRELELPSPETFGDRFPHQVSGGQLQRAMAAMAMSCRPDIIVLDEPTTALDVTTQIEVLGAVRRLIRECQTAGLYISHDLPVVAQIADRMMVLRNGRQIEIGTTPDILDRPTQAYTQKLLSVHKAAHGQAASTTAPRPLLTLDKVSARYGSHLALDQVSLVVEQGKTLAVVGESGSGKSTLGRVIAGLQPLQSGGLQLDGRQLPSGLAGRGRDLLRRIQIIYQMPDVALNPRQRIGDILARPVRFYFGRSAHEVRARVEELLRLIDLPSDYKNRLPGELSGGQKQRICIARALAAEPDLVICDEVTSALDPLVAQDILALLERLQREARIAYLFITHDLSIVRRVAHHVLVLRHGKVVETGPLPQTFLPPCDPYTELLLHCVPEMRTDWLDDVLRLRGGPVPAPPTLAG